MTDEFDAKAREIIRHDTRYVERASGEYAELVSAISSALRSAVMREREENAKIVDAKTEWILSRQDGKCDTVDMNLRLIAVTLPDIAASIRARRNSNDKG